LTSKICIFFHFKTTVFSPESAKYQNTKTNQKY
jgi:hypothetical protein